MQAACARMTPLKRKVFQLMADGREPTASSTSTTLPPRHNFPPEPHPAPPDPCRRPRPGRAGRRRIRLPFSRPRRRSCPPARATSDPWCTPTISATLPSFSDPSTTTPEPRLLRRLSTSVRICLRRGVDALRQDFHALDFADLVRSPTIPPTSADFIRAWSSSRAELLQRLPRGARVALQRLGGACSARRA